MALIKSYTLYRTLADGRDGGILGYVIQNEFGWWFNPQVAGRKPSRKHHPTFDAAIPRWTGHPNGTRSELRKTA
jgi:hypothetical protein